MLRIFGAIKSQEKKNKFLFWSLLGPVFLLFSLLLASLNTNFFRIDLWFVVVLGLFLCFLLKKEGLWASLSLLIIAAIFKHIQISSFHFWQIGLEGSIALGFIITALGFEYLSEMIESFEEKRRTLLQELSMMEEKQKKEGDLYQSNIKQLEESIDHFNQTIEKKDKEIFSCSSLIEALRKNENQNFTDREIFVNEALEKERKINVLEMQIQEMQEKLQHFSKEICIEKENKELLNELNEVRKEKQQSFFVNEALALIMAKKNAYKKEKRDFFQRSIVKKEKSFEKRKEEKIPIAQAEVLYKQLKKQFEEKKKILHETRSALFYANEKLLAKEKEENLVFQDISDENKTLFQDLFKMEGEIRLYEKEIKELYALIFALCNEKK